MELKRQEKLENYQWRGKNTDFFAEFSATSQTYTVYYKGEIFARKFRKRDIQCYLN